jgi:hypothetical protein
MGCLVIPRCASFAVIHVEGESMSEQLKKSCQHDRCFVPDTPCFLGEVGFPPDCKHFMRDADSKASIASSEIGKDFPWTGNTFGLDDAEWLAAWRRLRVFAPVGAFNAGKTTFLVSLYLGILRGARPGGHFFAGSYTLGGWENLAAYMRYRPDGIGPTFPPHTVLSAKGTPGLLHFTFRGLEQRPIDLLLADGMGEWFSHWALNLEDSAATGARWIAKKADGFLFFVDSEALAGPDRGSARDALFKLALRLSHQLGERPLAVVWTKCDLVVSAPMRKQVEERMQQCFPNAPSFEVSVLAPASAVEPAEAFLKVLSWLLNVRSQRVELPPLAALCPSDPFLSYRGKSA